MSNGRDDNTEIPYTVGDRVLAERTSAEIDGAREDIRRIETKFDAYLEAHTKVHTVQDSKINTVQASQRFIHKVFKVVAMTLGAIAALISIAKGFGLI